MNVPVTVSVEWNTPKGIAFSGNLLSASNVSSALHTSINVTDSGSYSCRAMVFSTYGIGTAQRNLSIVVGELKLIKFLLVHYMLLIFLESDTLAVLFQLKLIHIKDCLTWTVSAVPLTPINECLY